MWSQCLPRRWLRTTSGWDGINTRSWFCVAAYLVRLIATLMMLDRRLVLVAFGFSGFVQELGLLYPLECGLENWQYCSPRGEAGLASSRMDWIGFKLRTGLSELPACRRFGGGAVVAGLRGLPSRCELQWFLPLLICRHRRYLPSTAVSDLSVVLAIFPALPSHRITTS